MSTQTIAPTGHVLTDWRPEEAAFWAGGGKRIATARDRPHAHIYGQSSPNYTV